MWVCEEVVQELVEQPPGLLPMPPPEPSLLTSGCTHVLLIFQGASSLLGSPAGELCAEGEEAAGKVGADCIKAWALVP